VKEFRESGIFEEVNKTAIWGNQVYTPMILIVQQ